MPNTAGEWIFQILTCKEYGETFEQIENTFGDCLDYWIYDEYFEHFNNHPKYSKSISRLKFVYDNFNVEVEDNIATTYIENQ